MKKIILSPSVIEIQEYYSKSTSGYVDRTTMNTWEDERANKAVTGDGKKKIVMADLWTSVCIVGPVLSEISEGYDANVITDASGDVSLEAHDQSVTHMVQAGAKPLTSLQYLLELQRDWVREETYKPVNELVVKYNGAYGIGVQVCTGDAKTLNNVKVLRFQESSELFKN